MGGGIEVMNGARYTQLYLGKGSIEPPLIDQPSCSLEIHQAVLFSFYLSIYLSSIFSFINY